MNYNLDIKRCINCITYDTALLKEILDYYTERDSNCEEGKTFSKLPENLY